MTAEEAKVLYTVRDFRSSDANFVLATFLRGLYYGDSKDDSNLGIRFFSLIPKDIFMNTYKHVAEALINSEKTVVKIACLKDDEDVILGYSILSNDYQAITWVFVKSAWRRNGIGRALVPKRPTTITHLTALGRVLMPKFEGAVFNPFYYSDENLY